jgi:hypothetical protein
MLSIIKTVATNGEWLSAVWIFEKLQIGLSSGID